MRKVVRIVGRSYGPPPMHLTCTRYELECGHTVASADGREKVACTTCGER